MLRERDEEDKVNEAHRSLGHLFTNQMLWLSMTPNLAEATGKMLASDLQLFTVHQLGYVEVFRKYMRLCWRSFLTVVPSIVEELTDGRSDLLLIGLLEGCKKNGEMAKCCRPPDLPTLDPSFHGLFLPPIMPMSFI
ncbi:unnamed protein product [Taenia asiatica]|uniref:Tho2 domain-containing protein n=1 Tax=Taenia asiatica TaxID=60517 RepID=A0A0R3WDI0_TAEAS|nr:unnamed protein product [Taenia asiatica]